MTDTIQLSLNCLLSFWKIRKAPIVIDEFQVELISLVSEGSSTRRVLVREAKNHAALALILGTSKHSTLG